MGAGHMTSVLFLVFVSLSNSFLSKSIALQRLQNRPGRARVHGNLGLLGRAVLPVLVPVPVLVLDHPPIGHLGRDAGVGAHGKEGAPAGCEEGLLSKQLVFLLMVFGGIEQ